MFKDDYKLFIACLSIFELIFIIKEIDRLQDTKYFKNLVQIFDYLFLKKFAKENKFY